MSDKKKLIVILGPTATGKTKLAVSLAKRFKGEIVSADSRQVYRGLNIGTGKDLKDYHLGRTKIPYHLIDVVGPHGDFNVARYQKLAYQALNNIWQREKVPFLVGGTGLYLDAVIKGYQLPTSDPQKQKQIRKKLDKLSLNRLLTQLKKVDPKTFSVIDQKNRRRVQRSLEIYYETGRPKSLQPKPLRPPYDILILGTAFPLPEIYDRVSRRLKERLRQGMIREVRALKKRGISWKKMESWGLEYRYISRYLRGLISYKELLEQLNREIRHFAKRQLTWFRRDSRIIWLNDFSKAEKLVGNFLSQR
ncbi:MAG: tRNA (adenosine(37)-N6)-dimethylallyltransferase MiaA [Patescibacteria group bacterium]